MAPERVIYSLASSSLIRSLPLGSSFGHEDEPPKLLLRRPYTLWQNTPLKPIRSFELDCLVVTQNLFSYNTQCETQTTFFSLTITSRHRAISSQQLMGFWTLPSGSVVMTHVHFKLEALFTSFIFIHIQISGSSSVLYIHTQTHNIRVIMISKHT